MTGRARPWTTRTRWFVAIGYVLCWVVGLIVGGPALAPDADAAEVIAEFGGSLSHFTFAALVHGIAAVLLVALGWSLASDSTYRATIGLAIVAAGLSLIQFAGEILLIAGPGTTPAPVVWELITRVDGVKMLVLAGLIALVHGGYFRQRVVFTIFSAAACLALLLSGIGYLALIPFLMEAAAASLPLLLIWALAATAVQVTAGIAADADMQGAALR